MEPSVQTLIGALPPYKDEWVVIHPNQQVHDIIREVLDAHKEFAPYYDDIALYFDATTLDETCDDLYRFCKKNLRYKEEGEEQQTTALPTGLLKRGYCDCKGYAGFCGGVLDALNRLTGRKINWCYRFASYSPFDSTPHHVFIVVRDGSEEMWIDPTPNSDRMTPVWETDKKISGMPLMRNIAGVGDGAIGIASLTVTPYTQPGETQLNFSAQGIEPRALAGMWTHYLGLSDYRDYSGDRDINEWSVAGQLNNLIAQNGGTHTVDGNFVKWVYDNSIRSWNFFYPGGVDPNYDGKPWLDKFMQAMNEPGWPYWVITQDGRLTIDHDVKMDDYRNAGIHIMTAWAQVLINKYDGAPYPVKPVAVKEFSQNYTGNPGNTNANMFAEARGSSFFQDVGKAINNAVNAVKDAIVTVIGIIPRNAFLALVGLNVFHMATDLQNSITNGHWDEISDTWKKLGGNPDKLKSTIDHGAGQPAIEDDTTQVDPSTVTGVTGMSIGFVQVAAIIAAATPIIMALLKFLNKDGKLNGAILATEAALQTAFPDANFSFMNGALTSGGTPVGYQTLPQYDENSPLYNPAAAVGSGINPVFIGAGVGAGSYLLLFKRQPRNKRLIYSAGLGVIAWWLWRKRQQQIQAAQLQALQQLQQQSSSQYSTSDFQNILTSLETGLQSYLQQPSADTSLSQDTSVDYNLYSDPNLNNTMTV